MIMFLIEGENKSTKKALTKRKQAQLYREMYELLKAEGMQLKQINGRLGREVEIYNQRGELIGDIARYEYGLIYTYYKDYSFRTSTNPQSLLISIKKDIKD